MLRLLVASSDGYLYVYNLDMAEGGECPMWKQHRYDSAMISLFSVVLSTWRNGLLVKSLAISTLLNTLLFSEQRCTDVWFFLLQNLACLPLRWIIGVKYLRFESMLELFFDIFRKFSSISTFSQLGHTPNRINEFYFTPESKSKEYPTLSVNVDITLISCRIESSQFKCT